MQDMRIEAYRVPEKPDYGPLARHLLDRAIAFFADPENVAAYEKWRKEKRDGTTGVCSDVERTQVSGMRTEILERR